MVTGDKGKLLFEDIFRNYSKEIRPVRHQNESVQVELAMSLRKLKEIDTKHQHITVVGWVTASWKDLSLSWNRSQYEDLDYIAVNPELVWLPTFVLGNSAQDALYIDEWYKLFKVKIFSDGRILWSPGGVFIADCDIDIALYPFDTQICFFKFENWIYTGEKVNLTLAPNADGAVLRYFQDINGQWNIFGSQVTRKEMYYSSNIPFPEVYFAVKFQRKTLFYIVNIILVSIFLMLLVLLTFFLPTESGERISMGVTVLLSFSVFILMINDEIPKTSNGIPVIIIYLILCIALSTFSIIETVFVLNLYHANYEMMPPTWLCNFVYHVNVHCFCNNSNKMSKHTNSKDQESTVSRLVKASFDNALYSNGTSTKTDYQISGNSVFDHTENEGTEHNKHQIEKEPTNEQQWKEIARIIDKFSFCLFLILFLSVLVSLVVVLPRVLAQKDFYSVVDNI